MIQRRLRLHADIQEALSCLLGIWAQYGPSDEDANGDIISLNHSCMTAGEDATDILQRYGLGRDDGWDFVLSPAGKRLLNWRPDEPSEPDFDLGEELHRAYIMWGMSIGSLRTSDPSHFPYFLYLFSEIRKTVRGWSAREGT